MSLAITLAVLFLLLAVIWRFLGQYLVCVYSGKVCFLGFVERPIYRILGVNKDSEQTWKRYSGALIIFSSVSLILSYAILRLQGQLPFNPQHLGAVPQALSWNTSVSFVTNTNWQNYAGETTMSYFSQMVSLSVQQFLSAAAGVAVAVALIRGFARNNASTIGNFWIDMIRGVFYIFLPISFIAGLIFVWQGSVQTLKGPALITNHLTGITQTIARGPAGFMEAIKEFGTNGGGFFNANGSHPFENPTALTAFLSIILLLSIPVALTYTFGKMVGNIKQGLALLAAVVFIFAIWTGFSLKAEASPNPAVSAAHVVSQNNGNMVGKETRFGSNLTDLYNISSTQTSTGSVAGANDSFTPIGGFWLLTGMMLGEVTPGGAGSGLYTLLLFALIAVFLGGLMVGRTPEYLGKKIQAKEVKLAAFGILVMPITVLILVGIAVSIPSGRAGVSNFGPHGFTEILYAFTSQANNNGSAFAGLNGNSDFYNIAGSIAMLLGRFMIMLPCLALAGVLAAKNISPDGLGTFKTDTPMFAVLVIGVILVVGGLTFFPAVALGPILEGLTHGKLY